MESNSLKYNDFYLLWGLLAGSLALAISWASNERMILENDHYLTKIKVEILDSGELKREKIDVNRADFSTLMQISGIGEVLARRIIEDRLQNGPYEHVSELTRVKGIGPKTVLKLEPQVIVSPLLESSRQSR